MVPGSHVPDLLPLRSEFGSTLSLIDLGIGPGHQREIAN